MPSRVIFDVLGTTIHLFGMHFTEKTGLKFRQVGTLVLNCAWFAVRFGQSISHPALFFCHVEEIYNRSQLTGSKVDEKHSKLVKLGS